MKVNSKYGCGKLYVMQSLAAADKRMLTNKTMKIKSDTINERDKTNNCIQF